ncbi:MAG: putative kinase domain protein, partial [Streblomastix strix]
MVYKFTGGAMGNTFLVRLKKTGVLYVMKRVDYLDENDKKMADDEIELMNRLSSRYTVRLVWTFIDRVDMYMVSEYCYRGDLEVIIAELMEMDQTQRIEHVWELFSQIIVALDFMHSKGVIHRDIKPGNIFIMQDGSARLGDFGLSKQLNKDDIYAKIGGTPIFIAPEVWELKRMDFLSDIFAVGAVIYMLLTGRHPFDDGKSQGHEIVNKIIQGKVEQLPEWVPVEMRKLVMSMIDSNQKQRPNTKIIMENEIIKKNIAIFEERERVKEEERLRKLQYLVLSPVNPISQEQLNQTRDEIKSLEEVKQLSEIIYQKLADALRSVRYIQTCEISTITPNMKATALEIGKNVVKVASINIIETQDIESRFKVGLMVELVDFVHHTPNNQITRNMLDSIIGIVENGSSEQLHNLFQIGAIQSIIPKIRYLEFGINNIIKAITIIIKNGWKQATPFQIPSFSTMTIQSRLQQLLLLPHPYLETLEKDGVIKNIIEQFYANKRIDVIIKLSTSKLLDSLYIQGIKLPSDLQQQVITEICEKTQTESIYFRPHAMHQVVLFALNRENHEAIIETDFIESSLEFFKNKEKGNLAQAQKAEYSIKAFQKLFIYGGSMIRKLIRQTLTPETLSGLKNDQIFGKEVKIMLITLSDPESIDLLVKMERPIELRNEEYKIELLRTGLIEILNNEIAKAFQLEDGEDWHLQSLYILSRNIPIKQKKLLFSKGVIQLMAQIQDSDEKDTRGKACEIISEIIEAGINGLKEGEQHPFLKPLIDDGTVNKLIQALGNQNNGLTGDKTVISISSLYEYKTGTLDDVTAIIATFLAKLYKASPLPLNIKQEIIHELIYGKVIKYNELLLLTECQENYDAILSNDFLKELSKDRYIKTLNYVRINYILMRIGSGKIKKKIARSVKEKIEELADDEKFNKLAEKEKIEGSEYQEIRMKIKEILMMITEIQRKVERNIQPEQFYSIEHLSAVKEEIESLDEDECTKQDLFKKLTETLKIIRNVQLIPHQQTFHQLSCWDIAKEIIDYIMIIIIQQIKYSDHIEVGIQNGLICEVFDLFQRIHVDDITQNQINAVITIVEKGSSKQLHSLFQMDAIKSITSKLQIKDKEIQKNIIKAITIIIKNGWKQATPFQIPSFSTMTIQSRLQQLLLLPHPYLETLEKDGVIKNIIEQFYANKRIDVIIKLSTSKLLDSLYIQGIKLPSDLQQQVITEICESLKDEKLTDRKCALDSLQLLALNKDNHEVIIANGMVDLSIEFINFAIENGIPDAILRIFITQDLSSITETHSQAFYKLTITNKDQLINS